MKLAFYFGAFGWGIALLAGSAATDGSPWVMSLVGSAALAWGAQGLAGRFE